MTTQHTPGNWLKDRNMILNAAGEEIARVSYERSGYVQGNARLIAEAPRLLEACQRVLDGLSSMTTEAFQHGGDKTLRQILTTAITMATGKEG